MSRLSLKVLVVATQALPIILLAEYLIFKTWFAFLFGCLSILKLGFSKCAHCETSFRDPRINRRLHVFKFWDTKLVDQCPVCNHPMALPL
jgi:hypothetical protein